MNARQPLNKLHRQPTDYPPLAPDAAPLRLPPWSYDWNRQQMGRQASGGCLYGGQSSTFWAPLRDLLHLTNGPAGCGVYANANRPQVSDGYSGLNLGTDFQEKDVVFGGELKLARAITEADRLFPANAGLSLLSTCPIALIGDDIDAVARRQQAALKKPVVAVHCAGYRRADGIGETHATITGTWRDAAAENEEGAASGAYDVTLLCREMHGAWREIVVLLESLGLRVVARWPAGGNRQETARLGWGRLVISVGMEYWAKRLQQQFAQPWVEVDFLGPGATVHSLRAIAAHFDAACQFRAEQLIAAHAASNDALRASLREQLAGRLYFSFSPLQLEETRVFTDFGLRVGSALQGWPERDGRWRLPARPRRYQEMTPAEVSELLAEAQPDLVDGLGQDAPFVRKQGYAVIDENSRAELTRAAIGFAGNKRLARTLCQLCSAPWRRQMQPPWQR